VWRARDQFDWSFPPGLPATGPCLLTGAGSNLRNAPIRDDPAPIERAALPTVPVPFQPGLSKHLIIAKEITRSAAYDVDNLHSMLETMRRIAVDPDGTLRRTDEFLVGL